MAKGFHHAPRFKFHDTLSADINPTIFILVYVDDIIITGCSSSLFHSYRSPLFNLLFQITWPLGLFLGHWNQAITQELLFILTGWQAREFYGTLKELSLMVYHIPALDQWADLLTKPLSPTRFVLLKDKLNVTDTSHARPPWVWGGLLGYIRIKEYKKIFSLSVSFCYIFPSLVCYFQMSLLVNLFWVFWSFYLQVWLL